MKPLNTFYDTLQVARSANDAVILTAYQTLCAQYHPDKDPSNLAGATPEMLLLAEAYAVVSDSEKRFAYDLSLTKRERDMRAEEEAEAAKAASSMFFPPIEMPPDLPDLTPLPPLPVPLNAGPTPVPVAMAPVQLLAPTPPPAPVPLALATPAVTGAPSLITPKRPPPKRAPVVSDFEPTVMELPPGFADTQPPGQPDSPQVMRAREDAPAALGHPAVEWLRERPVALLGVLILGIALVALAPWALRVFHAATQSKTPVIQDIHPTYVEPPLVAAPVSPAASTPLPEAAAVPDAPASEAAAASSLAVGGAMAAVAGVAAASAVAEPTKPVRSPKRVGPTKTKSTQAQKAPEPVAPARAAEPAPAPPVLDPGGHSGFAPKCRWVTPTKWSCN